MARHKKHDSLTEKELEIMQILWTNGPMHVREMLEYYPEPRPHFNTVSTIVRILEQNGHVSHTEEKGGYRYHAVSRKEDFRHKSLRKIISDYFDNSYIKVVSALVREEKISVDDLRSLIDRVERSKNDKEGEKI